LASISLLIANKIWLSVDLFLFANTEGSCSVLMERLAPLLVEPVGKVWASSGVIVKVVTSVVLVFDG
jgi:hypothetical protein